MKFSCGLSLALLYLALLAKPPFPTVVALLGKAPLFPGRRTVDLSSTSQNPDESESSLSGLVNGMLHAQQEISKENKRQLERGNRGVYNILSEQHYRRFQQDHADKLIILKFSSPVCAACRHLKPHFQKLHATFAEKEKPVVFADIVVNNKNFRDPFRDFVSSKLNVRKLPTVQLYATGGQLIDTVACDPQGCSWSQMKQQMVNFVNQWAPNVELSNTPEGIAASETGSLEAKRAMPSMIVTAKTRRGGKILQRIRRFLGRRQE